MKISIVLGTRPDTLGVGSNVLVGTEPKGIVSKARLMLSKRSKWANSFGDGKAGTDQNSRYNQEKVRFSQIN